jgi:two-component system sensor histidine kinase KdpD
MALSQRADESEARIVATARAVAIVVGALLAATGGAAVLEGGLGIADASPVYLLAVVFVAGLYGAWAAVATSVVALLVYDFLFTAPRFTFAVADPQEWLSLLLFLLVAAVIGRLTALLRERAETADRRSRESHSLVAISRFIAMAPSFDEAAAQVAERLLTDAEMRGVLVTMSDPGGASQVPVASAGHVPATTPASEPWVLLRGPEVESSDWVRVVGQGGGPAGAASADSVPDATPDAVETYLVPIETDGQARGAIIATRRVEDPRPGRGARRILTLAADQLGIAIRRDDLRAELTATEVARQSDALKAAILDSVSHDLRTPLASIRATAGGLLDPAVDVGPEERRSMAAAIDEEAARLADFLRGLLDMSRVQAGAIQPDLEPYDLAELVETAIRRLGRATAGRTLVVAIPADLPPVLVDPVLFDVAATNVLDNAFRYAPTPAVVRVTARMADEPDEVLLAVDDGGPGVPLNAIPRLFDRFYRLHAGADTARHGLGMGLAIARGFLEAMGATIEAGPSDLGGLSIRIGLPVAEAHEPVPRSTEMGGRRDTGGAPGARGAPGAFLGQ